MFKILFKASVKKDLRNIDKKEAKKIIGSIVNKLTENPKAGMKLTGDFSGLYSYRIGDYRVIYTMLKDGVLVLRVGHRKDVYS